MSKKMIWGLAALIILIGAAVVVLLLQPDPKPEVIYNDIEPAWTPQPPPAEPGFKWVWHENHWDKVPVAQEGEHPPDPIEASTPDWTPAQVQVPEGITDPDVKAAWERLEYISQNRHQWGQFSPRALELMNELTPVPSIYDTTEGEDCGGTEIIFLLDELSKLRDPRSAELLLSYQMDSGISGNPPHESLQAMGPASVPALIARLDYSPAEDSLFDPLDLLPQIVAAHRSELDGIVEHIIIPKIKAIAAYEGPGERSDANKQFALNALESILQKQKSQD